MSNRITEKDIDIRLGIINKYLGIPEDAPYNFIGRVVASYQYGGLNIEQVVTDGGAVRTLGYFQNKREAYHFLIGMIEMRRLMEKKSLV